MSLEINQGNNAWPFAELVINEDLCVFPLRLPGWLESGLELQGAITLPYGEETTCLKAKARGKQRPTMQTDS